MPATPEAARRYTMDRVNLGAPPAHVPQTGCRVSPNQPMTHRRNKRVRKVLKMIPDATRRNTADSLITAGPGSKLKLLAKSSQALLQY